MNKNLIGLVGQIGVGKDEVGQMLIYMDSYDIPTFKHYCTGYVNLESSDIYQIKKYADKLKDIVCILIGCTRIDLENRLFKETVLPNWTRYAANFVTPNLVSRTMYFSTNEEAHKAFGPDGDLNRFKSYKVKEEKMTPRKILQLLGTECCRMQLHPDTWCMSLFNKYIEGDKWVVTDVRFPNNEGRFISERGGTLIGIKREFGLRYPEYKFLEDENHSYKIPYGLHHENPELYLTLSHESEFLIGECEWADYVIENNGTLEDLFNNVLELYNSL